MNLSTGLRTLVDLLGPELTGSTSVEGATGAGDGGSGVPPLKSGLSCKGDGLGTGDNGASERLPLSSGGAGRRGAVSAGTEGAGSSHVSSKSPSISFLKRDLSCKSFQFGGGCDPL